MRNEIVFWFEGETTFLQNFSLYKVDLSEKSIDVTLILTPHEMTLNNFYEHESYCDCLGKLVTF